MKKERQIKFGGLAKPTLDQLFDYFDLARYNKIKVIFRQIDFLTEQKREIVFTDNAELEKFILRNTAIFVRSVYAEYDEEDDYYIVFETNF